ncbi:MAG: hypothetical protein CMF72_22670 [Mameliella sp.]|nr:hypothetical protein [Mameliella sp.]|tara:strand:- start:157 stop:1176 length:1020 start_codon:yes stop_codon:yes gene_type:complete
MVAREIIRSNLFGSSSVTRVTGEPVALFGTTVRALRYTPERILSVYSYDETTGAKVYFGSDDFTAGASGIARTVASSIYDFDNYAITMTGGTYELVTSDPRNPPIVMYRLVYVDYDTAFQEPTLIPALAPSPLSGHIVTAGDSITGGAHTVSRENFDSDADGYVGIIRNHFRNVFDVTNFSFNGSSIGQLTTGLPAILAGGPSALTVAFGQNDHVAGLGAPLVSFEDALTDIVDDAQAAGVYVVLLGFMPKNPLWENYNATSAAAYNQAIADVATATGAAFVDIEAAWAAVRADKTHMELTGDNHHHPNNYGSRLYASALLPFLNSQTIYTNELPWFVG